MKNSSINNFLATLRFGRPYVGYLLLISLLNLLTIAADLGFLYLLKKLIDTGFATQSLTILKWLALGALGILLLRSASGYASGFLSNYVNGRMAADIQDSLYSKIQQLSMDFHTDISTGDLLTLVFYHTNAMLQIITSISGIMIKELFRIPALTVFLFSLHTGLALFALLVFPPSLLGLRLLRNVITRTTQNTHGVLSQLYETAEQTLSHTEIIKTFAKEAEEAKRFKDLNKEMVSRSIKAYQAAGLSGPATQLLKMVGVTFLVFLGTHEVAQGELSVGGLTTFLASAYYFYGALSSFTNWYLSLLTGLVSADKVFKVLRIQPAVLPPIKGVTPCPFEKGIVLRDVSLRYPSEEKEALKGINLRIAKGETIALVGPSGSGKSSLIKLFLRLYDPTKGTILLDAHKLSNIDLAALRGLFGVAPQDPGIFQDSVEAAVTYGRPRASKEEVSEAVRMAGAHEFISNLPQGYQTLIGERAVKLSGGEKQRLALARALLRNPEILILDEALSSVDGSTEKAILQSISSNRRGRTNILISHRLMSIVHADRIVVMDRGAIIEEGNHKELLAASTKYREWFFIQQSEVSA